MFRLQHSTKRIYAAIGDIGTIQCILYCNLGAKFSAHPSVYAVWTVVPAVYSVITVTNIQYSIFNSSYLRCYCIYVHHSASVILQTWYQYSAQPPDCSIWIVVPAIYSVITVPHIQASIFNWTYLRCYRRYITNSMRLILQTLCQIQCIPPSLRHLNCGPWHIQWIYSSAYSGFNIQMNVCALL
jgi:hypothetical protein